MVTRFVFNLHIETWVLIEDALNYVGTAFKIKSGVSLANWGASTHAVVGRSVAADVNFLALRCVTSRCTGTFGVIDHGRAYETAHWCTTPGREPAHEFQCNLI